MGDCSLPLSLCELCLGAAVDPVPQSTFSWGGGTSLSLKGPFQGHRRQADMMGKVWWPQVLILTLLGST